MKMPATILALAVAAQGFSQISIIPQPVEIRQPKIAAHFTITPATQLVLEGSGLDNSVNFFNDYLQECYHFRLKTTRAARGKNVIVLNYERLDKPVAGAYRMTVNGQGIQIAGDNETGVFYGIQTLIQLLPVPGADPNPDPRKLAIPYVSILDYPRFAYRGLHLDVGRHFMPVSFVKKYIDYIALHKMNYFQWHLTEDQGWRIEIKKYPRLTSVGAWRNGTIIGHFPGTGNDNTRDGGFYTQDEIRDVVRYAAERYITIIPEIEMPGHGSAAIAAYPYLSCFPEEPTIRYFPKKCTWSGDSTGKQVQQTWGVFSDVFCAGKETTFQFMQDVMDEVMALFPSKYIHIGGDECPKSNWKRCPLCQQRIRENGLKDEHELQRYFIQRMEKYLNSKGRSIIGWDEILEGGLAPNATVMSWRGEKGGIEAARQHHHVIMTPTTYVYFDYAQTKNEDSVVIGGYLPLDKVYNYEPLPAELSAEETGYIMGAQANVWTEYMKYPSKVEYMIFPRLSALSEVLWTPRERKDWNDFQRRMPVQFKRYELWKASYSKALLDPRSSIGKPTEQ
ncbi:MAG TPA: beta-N-acetylhexosaminidase [Chitinophagaceae bacterium]|nr:beta-N-acetylhexosaminidase [Chitinophagaceae bacterium]